MSNRRAAHHIAIFYSLHTKLGSGLSGEEQCVTGGTITRNRRLNERAAANSWRQIMVSSVTGALRKIHFDIECSRPRRPCSATLAGATADRS